MVPSWLVSEAFRHQICSYVVVVNTDVCYINYSADIALMYSDITYYKYLFIFKYKLKIIVPHFGFFSIS